MSTAQNNNQDIAIIGLACRFPEARDYQQFWENLVNGRYSVTKIPLERFDKPNIFSDAHNKNKQDCYGGFIDDVAAFDADFFGISRKEAECMDPQQRILMELTWSCFEDAGIAKSDWAGKKIGTFIGVTNFDYKEIQEKRAAQGVDIFYATATAPAVIANRLSYYFNFKGPSIAIDTACSSSLNAIHLAIQSMQSDECEMAIAGGISLLLSDTRYISLQQMGILSPTGNCKTFEDSADGYVRSEGAGLVLLKPLAKALRDGDLISGIIKGSAVNHSGKTYTLTYPSADAQAEVLIAAFAKAGISPESVSYMELHGTGTPKGDPIEFDGLCKAFAAFPTSKKNERKNYCGLASVKSNIGHLESAAGVAGLIKVILAMKHHTLPPMQDFKQLNHRILLENTPFYMVDKLTKWESSIGKNTTPLRAGISSFGFAGTNAHVIVEENPVKINTEYTSELPAIIVLSAKDKTRLNEQATNLKAYLSTTTTNLFDIAYTLQIGREPMSERVAFITKDKETLLGQLGSFIEKSTEKDNGNIFIGSILKDQSDAIFGNEVGQSFLNYAIANKEIKTLAQLWAKGMDIDWKLLYPDNKPNKTSLPTYPFAKEIFWLPELANHLAPQQINQQLHPLLHSNISNFREQKFTSLYTGQEDFLIDHQVKNKKILPGVAYLELAREAATQASQQTITQLTDVTWLSPIQVNGDTQQVQTSLFGKENDEVIAFKVLTQKDGVEQLHCEGKACAKIDKPINNLDVAAIKTRLHQSKIGKDCYQLFAEKGLDYGTSFQGIEIIYFDENEALSKIILPKQAGYTLSPGLLDSALQTCMALDFSKKENGLQLPFSVKEVVIYKDLSQEIWCYASKSSNNKINSNITAFNVYLLDLAGEVLLTFRDFVTLPIDSNKKNNQLHVAVQTNEIEQENSTDMLFVPVWERVANIQSSLIIGNGKQLLVTSHGHTKNTIVLKEILAANQLEIAETIETEGITDVYILHGLAASNVDLHQAIEQKELAVFHSIKALLTSTYKGKNLHITFVTVGTQKVLNADKVSETGAGIIGLAGSLAKEHPFWKIRMIDVETENLSTNDWLKVLLTPFDDAGLVSALRRGHAYKRVLYPINLSAENKSKFRKNGVYVILGGAGGLGKVTTAHLVKNYNAQVIWLGRKPLDETITEAQNEIEKLGVRPMYISCDANNKISMEKAFMEIKAVYPNINGLFHSAIVLNDMLLKNMDETDFRKSFEPKSLASQHFIEIFSNEPLDFICFYSSAQSQLNAPGQGNYSAGCNYKDSFAYSLEQKLNIPVHIINWGYWSEVGIVASKTYQKKLSISGIGSITTAEGLKMLEEILSSEQKQVIAIKLLNKENAALVNIVWNKQIKPSANTSAIHFYLPTIAPYQKDELAEIELEKICSLGLLQVLFQMDLQKNLQLMPQEIRVKLGIKDQYQRLFNSLINLLQQANYLALKENKIIILKEIKDKIQSFNLNGSINKLSVEHPEYVSKCKLLLVCLNALEHILIGAKQATDPIFPDGSLNLVSGIYKNNYSADYFNELLANIVLRSVSAAITALKPNEKIKILEVGAGTGGSSEVIFKKLLAYKNQIEYVYTDVSKSFLMYAEDNYKTIAPYLKTALFNIEQSPEKQNFAIGEFDIIIGVNVVHATKNIANTLSNIKPLLKKNGLLLLNEIAKTELFTSLTFGLLDGWWLYEDVELRLDGSPGLSAESWDTVLTEIGFTKTTSWPQIFDLSQQIIVAKSDGNIQLDAEKALQIKPEVNIIETVKKTATVMVDKDWITNQLIIIAAGTIKLPKEEFDTEEQFMDYGFDSILGTTLVKNINEALHISLTPTDIFNYTNIAQLAVYIQETFADEINAISAKPEINKQINILSPKQENHSHFLNVAETIQTSAEISSTKPTTKTDIAIVGISGQFGSANNLEEYWTALKEGKSLIEEVPEDRFDVNKFYSTNKDEPNKTYCKWGSFLKDIDKFDPLFFKISGSEAKMMDPQQRLFLEHCWKAIEDAAIDPQKLKTTKCGVFVGVAPSDYLDSIENKAASAFWGNTSSILASRISYFLDLKGPAISLDTACSSSLVAINMGCASLQSGDTDMIITGGVTVFNSADFYIHSSRSGMLSADGKCYAFDSRANGFVPGEGVGVVIMKRLEDAKRDGNQIYGIIKGSLINQDGTTNGIFAPSALSQKQLEKDVYTKFNIHPETISYVEAHGTGTSLGDPIEFEALSGAFKSFTQQKQFCSLGSVKTNIGHTLVAAGVAGLLKILLAFKHKQLPPTINYKENNPLINLANSPFKIQEKLEDWENSNGLPRRAALSSFGFSGTNAHIVLEEHQPTKTTYIDNSPVLIVLSAKNTERLDEQVLSLKSFLEASPVTSFYDIAYTLQIGREAMEERLALIVNDKAELVAQLKNYLLGNKQHVITGNSKTDKTNFLPSGNAGELFIKTAIQNRELATLAQLWVKGTSIDWSMLYPINKPRKISLPTYPFERKRYWLDLSAKPEPIVKTEIIQPLKPLSNLIPNEIIQPLPFKKVPVQKHFNLIDIEEKLNQPVAAKEKVKKISLAMTNVLPEAESNCNEKEIVTTLLKELSNLLYLEIKELGVNKTFNELGLDSILAVELIKTINRLFNIELKASKLYDYPTIAELSGYLKTLIIDSGSDSIKSNTGIDLQGLEELKKANVSESEQQSINHFFNTIKAEESNIEPIMLAKLVEAKLINSPSLIKITLTEIETFLLKELGVLLYLEQKELDANKVFSDVGLDSILAVELIKKINKHFNVELKASKLYDYPTVKELALYLSTEITDIKEAFTEVELSDNKIIASHTDMFKAISIEGDYETEKEVKIYYEINTLNNACLRDHLVFDKNLLPTDAYIEILYSALIKYFAVEYAEITNVLISKPFVADEKTSRLAKLQLKEMADGRLRFIISSKGTAEETIELVHIKGFETGNQYNLEKLIWTDEKDAQKIFTPAELKSLIPHAATKGIYADTIKSLVFTSTGAAGRIELTKENHHTNIAQIMDAALGFAMSYGPYVLKQKIFFADDIAWLPYAIQKTIIAQKSAVGAYYCVVRETGTSAEKITLDFEVTTEDGQVVLRVEGLELRPVKKEQLSLAISPEMPSDVTFHATKSVKIEQKTPASVVVASQIQPTDIAIIGMSCRYAGAENTNEFWKNLSEGIDSIIEVETERWDGYEWYNPDPLHEQTAYCKWGGFVKDADKFDPLFFGISPREAEMMDPQQRLFLEESWKAMEDAGYSAKALNRKKVGVFVGAGAGDYLQLLQQHNGDKAGSVFTGNSQAILAARVSYFMNLTGPAMPIDTACSSSLVAINRACESILNGESEMALAGGIALLTTPMYHIWTSQVGMPSKDGKCKTFDNDADGIVPGEGVGLIVLKKLADAEKDSDRIYAVIKGSGVNQDGKTNGITAPSARSQTELESSIYKKYGIDPSTISFVEAHGTGTKLGDPIEIDALTDSFNKYTDKKQFCAIGSVKTNIGHTGFASGVAGVIKTILMMRNKQYVPSLHYNETNTGIDLQHSPFYVNTQLKEWKTETDIPRRAAVSSFGFSGTNAHLVMEEYQPKAAASFTSMSPAIIVLSAKNEDRLKALVLNLKNHVELNQNINLYDIAYTLQIGREVMEERLAFVANNKTELLNNLSDYLKNNSANLLKGNINQENSGFALEGGAGQAYTQYVIDNKESKPIAQLWVKGVDINWNLLYPTQKPNKVSLPGYPFQRKRCWIDTSKSKIVAPAASNINNKVKLIETPIKENEIVLDELKIEIKPIELNNNKTDGHVSIVPNIGEIETILSNEICRLLYLEPEELAENTAFHKLGLDSILGIELIKSISHQFKINVTATKLYAYPTIKELAAYLHKCLLEETATTIAVPKKLSDDSKSQLSNPAKLALRSPEENDTLITVAKIIQPLFLSNVSEIAAPIETNKTKPLGKNIQFLKQHMEKKNGVGILSEN